MDISGGGGGGGGGGGESHVLFAVIKLWTIRSPCSYM